MITARVIRIISAKQLIFSAGAADGVRRGMRFEVLTPPVPITDPTTESLGDYEPPGILLEPDQIYERFTVASQPYSDPGP